MSNIKLITVCSRTDEYGFEMLKKTVEKFNWPFVVLKTEWHGFGTKLLTAYQYLKQSPDITHFFFCDAYDVVLLGDMEEALMKIKANCGLDKMIIGAERGCWPDGSLETYYAKHEHGFNYVNSGLYFAPVKLFLELFEKDAPEYSTDDQLWLTRKYLFENNDKNIVLDTSCNVFQNYSFLRDGDYKYENGWLSNENTHTKPVFVHGNGRTDLTKVYALVNSDTHDNAFNTFMEKTTEQQKQAVNDVFKRDCRLKALASAQSLNPTTVNHGQAGLHVNNPPVTSVLSDADKIYEWLIKDL